jgi:hypothetical protein
MNRVIRIAVMVLVALAVMVPAYAAGKVTVGDFLTQIAQVKNLSATDAATAAASLKAAGVNLPVLDMKADLNEGTVAQIAGALGLNVSTNNPDASFSATQVDAFVATFASEIGRPIAGVGPKPTTLPVPGFDPDTKGKKKGHHKSQCDPE